MTYPVAQIGKTKLSTKIEIDGGQGVCEVLSHMRKPTICTMAAVLTTMFGIMAFSSNTDPTRSLPQTADNGVLVGHYSASFTCFNEVFDTPLGHLCGSSRSFSGIVGCDK